MPPQSYPFVIPNAVDAQFIAHVTQLTQEYALQFEANGDEGNRKFLLMDFVTPEGDPILFAAKRLLAERFRLGDYVLPPKLKDFISYITEGGAIQPHRDPDLSGKRHVRINVLVKQTDGCVPLLEGIPIKVAVGDAWLNLASKCTHATTPVIGPGYRSAISFGFQIDERRGDELLHVHEAWVMEQQGARLG